IAEREIPAADPWWIDELWEINSEWSPRGQRAFVTFLVDPQAPPHRRSGDNVWAVAITRDRPSAVADARPQIPLGPRWESRSIPQVVVQIEALRETIPGRAGQQQVEADKARER